MSVIPFSMMLSRLIAHKNFLSVMPCFYPLSFSAAFCGSAILTLIPDIRKKERGDKTARNAPHVLCHAGLLPADFSFVHRLPGLIKHGISRIFIRTLSGIEKVLERTLLRKCVRPCLPDAVPGFFCRLLITGHSRFLLPCGIRPSYTPCQAVSRDALDRRG